MLMNSHRTNALLSSAWPLTCLAVSLGALMVTAALGQAVRVTNYDDTRTVTYPVALLRGTLEDTGLTTVLNEVGKLASNAKQ